MITKCRLVHPQFRAVVLVQGFTAHRIPQGVASEFPRERSGGGKQETRLFLRSEKKRLDEAFFFYHVKIAKCPDCRYSNQSVGKTDAKPYGIGRGARPPAQHLSAEQWNTGIEVDAL